MRRRRALLLSLGTTAWLAGGCATPPTARVDPQLFPRRDSDAGPRTPGRVAVLVGPPLQALVVRGQSGPAQALVVPIGRIVGQALVLAAEDVFAGGAAQIEGMDKAGAGFDAMLRLEAARASYHSKVRWFIPLPWLVGAVGDMELDAQVAFEATLVDGRGRAVWTRTYDSGAQTWPHSWTEMGQAQEGLLRLSHQEAWQGARQAMAEVREWMLADRTRPREL